MPYENEHSARMTEPNYKNYSRTNDKWGKGVHAVWGIVSKNASELQAIRFDADKFTVAEAKKWCKDHSRKYILFEPAKKKEKVLENEKLAEEILAGSYEAVRDKLSSLVTEYCLKKKLIKKNENYAYIEATYPTYIVFKADAIYYKISYDVDADENIKLMGDHKEVKIEVKLKEQKGTDGKPLGEGGTDICVCSNPKCKTEVKHTRGTPCIKLKCPTCGSKMAGKDRPQTALKKEGIVMAELKEITEKILSADSRVDRENSVIHGVSLLNSVSKNGYTYQPEAMRRRTSLYEGRQVFKNHGEENRRGVDELAGVVRNARFESGTNRIIGDYHIVEKESWLLDVAEKMPEALAFSQHINQAKMSQDKKFVEDWANVVSLDLVTRGATNKTLFESLQRKPEGGDDDMDFSKLTAEGLRKERPDLVEKIREDKSKDVVIKELKEEVTGLKKDKDDLQLTEKKRQKELDIAKLLEEKKIPKEAISDIFKEQLFAEEDMAKIGELMDDRIDSWNKSETVVSREKQVVESEEITEKDKKEYKEAIRKN